jgi:hypothetical protein
MKKPEPFIKQSSTDSDQYNTQNYKNKRNLMILSLVRKGRLFYVSSSSTTTTTTLSTFSSCYIATAGIIVYLLPFFIRKFNQKL